MSYSVGTMVRARGREWVVLPSLEKQLLMVRPLGGTEDEVTGIYLPLEPVEAASFAPPDPSQLGDYHSCRLLRDAVRLGFRSSTGPFRSFANIAVEPRPYQLVPLLMALKLSPVRLLIADDVGIGKTVEAGLIARELLDRGEVERLAVLCPPQLVEQWQEELREKFHLDAEAVLPSTVSRLERMCAPGQSLFERYPYVVVSLDFVKLERRRNEFLRTCPELVIVDEAHTCTFSGEGRSTQHQRYYLISQLAKDPSRHLLLVTATPHSGKEDAFRSLLTLLNPDFTALSEDLSGAAHEGERRHLATYFVQRRRADIRAYLDVKTPFPEREESEPSYRLSPDYKRLLDKALHYARETVEDPQNLDQRHQRVRWWSALALLRSLSSSPAAAVATLRSRAAVVEGTTVDEADEIGRHTVLDLVENETVEGLDLIPGSDYGEQDESNAEGKNEVQRARRRLLDMANDAENLMGAKDEKLQKMLKLVAHLLLDGYSPILFCRFIPTAEYVARALRETLSKDAALKETQVDAVTGLLPPVEREQRILHLAQSAKRVLVCTDCLSEGINLQSYFNAVVHYDLSWNPTRHEQREGRVDRYGQVSSTVRVVNYYGSDNPIDGMVLEVLIRKHQTIRTSLGISVPVPVDANQVIEAIFEGLILRGSNASRSYHTDHTQLSLPGLSEVQLSPRGEQQKQQLFDQWEAASQREKRSRTVFAQETIKVDEVAAELRAVQAAIGSGVEVKDFTATALKAYGATCSTTSTGAFAYNTNEVPRALKDAMERSSAKDASFIARFELPIHDNELFLNRTHPVVEGLATYVMDTALDPDADPHTVIAKRCGVIRTSHVARRTTLLLLRLRYHIITMCNETSKPMLAEECQVLAFEGTPQNARWLDDTMLIDTLLKAQPEANIYIEQATHFLQVTLAEMRALDTHLHEIARRRGEALLEAHRRVRAAIAVRGVRQRVEPQFPVDMLGVYIYLPTVK